LQPGKVVVFGYLAKSWPPPRGGVLRVRGTAGSATHEANSNGNTAQFSTLCIDPATAGMRCK